MKKIKSSAAPESPLENVVVLHREDYDALLDRIDELKAGRASAATREEESFPAEVVDRLLAGESPVRVYREHRGLSGRELAIEIAKSPAYLSEIETGKAAGSVEVLRDIADALEVDLDDLVPPARD